MIPALEKPLHPPKARCDGVALADGGQCPGRSCRYLRLPLPAPAPRPPCIHLGAPTGETVPCPDCPNDLTRTHDVPILGCKIHGTTTGKRGAPGRRSCHGCRDYQAPAAAPAAEVLAIQVTADGLGDHLAGLVAAAGLVRQHPDKRIVYACKHHVFAEWLHLFDGVGDVTMVGQVPPGAKVLKPHDTYGRQLAERLAKPRWEYYAEACGTTAVLPTCRPLPEGAVAWAGSRGPERIVLAPFSCFVDRTWPLPSWLDLERRLIAAGHACVVIGSASDAARAGLFVSPKIFGASAAQVGALVASAACLVGNDSAMVHFAGLLHTPAIAVCALIPGEKLFPIYPTVRWLNGPLACTGCTWHGNLRAAAGCSDTRACASLWAITPADVADAVEIRLCPEARAHTLLAPDRLAALARAVRRTAHLDGAIAELGCYRGGSALAMAHAASQTRTRRGEPEPPLHLFDTFAGLPADCPEGIHKQGEFAAGEAAVRALLDGYAIETHVGRFPETAAGLDALRYRCVHVDGDLYETTRDAIAYFWPRLVPGGRLVFDDWEWAHTPGVARAIREAFTAGQIEVHALHQAQVQKP